MKFIIIYCYLTLLLFASENTFQTKKYTEVKEINKKVIDLLTSKYPQGELVSYVSCKFGEKSLDGYGLVVTTKKNKGLTDDELKPLIIIKREKGYKIFDVDVKLDVEGVGFIRSFISDFISDGKVKEKLESRCTNPKKDKDVDAKLGKYTIDQKSNAALLNGQHVCYQASNAYNSWACFVYDNKKDLIKLSFVQLMSD